jgi:hypothetical protein
MPFFLSDEFKTIIEEKYKVSDIGLHDGKDKMITSGTVGSLGLGGGGGSTLYKSEFLKEKLFE